MATATKKRATAKRATAKRATAKRATPKRAAPARRTYLVGDVGGTRTRLALHDDKSRAPLLEEVIPSREHATFEEIAERFLAGSGLPRPSASVIGVAGPVREGVAVV